MKDRAQIKEELERQYLHRLQLRLDRKLKNCCKNCKRGKEKEFNLGEFGIHSKFVCKDGLESGFPCSCFESLHTNESVERELLNDLKDPAIAGAKEPKIAALLWVLHGEKKDEENHLPTFIDTVGKIFGILKKGSK